VTATGWTWEYVDRYVTLKRYYALLDYWQYSPPINESAALFFGIKKPEKTNKKVEIIETFELESE